MAMLRNRAVVILLAIACLPHSSLQQVGPFDEKPVVKTSLGEIQGTLMVSRSGHTINAFRGIRYAKPPLGHLRFKAPQRAEAWNGTFNANRDSLICPQPGLKIFMSEDCLALNVYSRNLTASQPVIVYIHGGANVLGSGHSQYEAGPQYLLDHDVVVVSFNYRLGALGFLCTRTEHAQGNFGYLDQVMALEWVRDHIAQFGGNPNLVTLLGLSAGAMAITLHMVSDLSKHLFHRAIVMSGSATNHYHIDNLAWTRKLAREVSCPMHGPAHLVECLRNTDWKTIIDVCAAWEVYGFTNMKWNYEVDGHFLTAHPTTLYMQQKNNRVPIITGVTVNEGDFSLFHLENKTFLTNDLDENFDEYAPELFLFDPNDPQRYEKSKRIRELYFGKASNKLDEFEAFGRIVSDAIIGHGVRRLVSLASKTNNVFYYLMEYVGRKSLYMDSHGNPRGVGHADDWRYVMPSLWYGSQMSADDPDLFMVDRITHWWTTFARDGFPHATATTNWTALDAANATTILYNGNSTKLGGYFMEDRYRLWEDMFPLSASASASGTPTIRSIVIGAPLILMWLAIFFCSPV